MVMDKMKTILLMISIDSHFVELARAARVLKASHRYRPVIWFSVSYPALLRDLDICRSEGWEFVLSVSPPVRGRPSPFARLKRLINHFPQKISFLLFFVSGYFKYHRRIQTLVNETISLIREYQPSLLVVCDENAGYLTHIPIRICRMHKIETINMPYTIANASEAAETFHNSFEHLVTGNFINLQVARAYPRWAHVHRGKNLLRLPAAMIIPMERAGYGPSRPWILNSEGTTFIAVENERMLEYYRHENPDDEQLVVTGALYDDVLAQSVKQADQKRLELIRELGLQNGLPVLLCALPPSQFPRDCGFADYESLLAFWMSSLNSISGWNIVIRPHPRLTEDQIDMLVKFGFKISRWDTALLVPLCDLYVASVSATIRWAIACGKPAINYDVYQMKYKDYQDAGGVITVSNKSDFVKALTRMCTDKVYYQQIQELQKHEMRQWGNLDGKSSERILKLFDDVISGRMGRKSS
jgi:hypothetical protein